MAIGIVYKEAQKRSIVFEYSDNVSVNVLLLSRDFSKAQEEGWEWNRIVIACIKEEAKDRMRKCIC